MASVSRRQIVRACKTKGWSIQPGVLEAFEQLLNQDGRSPIEILDQLVEPHMMRGQKTITNQVWHQCVQSSTSLSSSSSSPTDTGTTTTRPIQRPQSAPLACRGNYENRRQGEEEHEARRQLSHKKISSNHNKTRPISRQEDDPDDDNDDILDAEDPWGKNGLQVVSAFHQPKLVYNTMREQFRVEDKQWSLFGTADEKVGMLAQRYALIHQRILRHERFRPTSLTQLYHRKDSSIHDAKEDDEAVQFHLTPLERLLGLQQHRHYRHSGKNDQYSIHRSILVLGMLRQLDQEYFLEDPTGLVPLSLERAQLSDPDLVLAEDSIYLVEGTWHDGTLQVIRLGPPLLESRHDSLNAIRLQIQHPLITPSSCSSQHRHRHHHQQQHPMVVLSDVHLDQPQALQHLEGILASYEVQRTVVPLFCFMGNFCSRTSAAASAPSSRSSSNGGTGTASGISASYWHSLLHDELVTTLRKFPYLAQHAHFILVPGPNDVPPSAVLPWALPPPPNQHYPSSSSANQSRSRRLALPGIRHLVLGTNPTRLYWNDQEWVLFRSLPQQQQQLLDQENEIILPSSSPKSSTMNEAAEDKDDPQERSSCALRLIKTMLDQGHMIPGGCGGMAPIYWNYDHALRLYPLPTGIVVGLGNTGESRSDNHDHRSPSLLDETYGGCRVVAPGSVGFAGQYAVVRPRERESRGKSRSDRVMRTEEESETGTGDMGDVVELLRLEPLGTESAT